jgi:hypothetical protein
MPDEVFIQITRLVIGKTAPLKVYKRISPLYVRQSLREILMKVNNFFTG